MTEFILLYELLALLFALSVSLLRVLLLFLRQRRFRFRLNGGFVAGFLRLNAYGFADPSPFLSLSRSHLSLLIVSPFLLTESQRRLRFRLNGGFLAGFRLMDLF